MECTDYINSMFLPESEGRELEILRAGLADGSRDMSELLTKWQYDLPVLLVCLRNTVSQVERMMRPDELDAANEMQKNVITVTVSK